MSLPKLLTVSEFCAWARIGRTKAYEEFATGALRAIKIGRRTFITADSAAAWFASRPAYLAIDRPSA